MATGRLPVSPPAQACHYVLFHASEVDGHVQKRHIALCKRAWKHGTTNVALATCPHCLRVLEDLGMYPMIPTAAAAAGR